MPLSPFTVLNFPEQQLNRLQDNVQTTVSSILRSQIIDGSLISNLNLVAGTPLIVNHGLNKVPTFCITVLQNANATIWATNLNVATLTLNASANVTVNIWVA